MDSFLIQNVRSNALLVKGKLKFVLKCKFELDEVKAVDKLLRANFFDVLWVNWDRGEFCGSNIWIFYQEDISKT